MDLEREILKYLESRQVFHYRQASGVATGLGGHRVGPKGAPNIICVIDGQYVGIKVTKHGVKASETQKVFRQALETAGGRYILALSLDDVKSAVESTRTSH